MTKQHYFVFSYGYYDGYAVNGLFVCDHEVPEQEWADHIAEYEAAMEKLQEEAYIAFGERTGFGTSKSCRGRTSLPKDFEQKMEWYSSPEEKEFSKWLDDNNPEKTFQKKHGMVEVSFQEMSRGD